MTDAYRQHGTILVGDCLEHLRTLPDCSVDSVVTDPPYGLSDHAPKEVIACLTAWLAGEPYKPKGKGFMGKSWDAWVPGPEVWRECLRVLKPGGHLVAFAGTRSMDLMAMAVRLAGFELRDAIGLAEDSGNAPLLAWSYGSGFPKSLDVSKAIDKVAGVEREKSPTVPMQKKGDVGEISKNVRCAICGKARASANPCTCPRLEDVPVTDAARQWQGWGTALKPAWEPIILARKPLDGTVAANVLAHGTGALNIDGCRIGYDNDAPDPATNPLYRAQEGYKHAGNDDSGSTSFAVKGRGEPSVASPLGRWPANVIHDGSDEVLACFPDAPGQQGDITGKEPSRPGKNTYGEYGPRQAFKARRDGEASADRRYTEEGSTNFAPLPGMRREPTSAARFFAEHQLSDEDWLWSHLSLVSIADSSLCLQSEPVASALSRAATAALPVGSRCVVSTAPSTNVTASELRRIATALIGTIQRTASECWHGQQPGAHSQPDSHARAAVAQGPTGITTITVSHWKSDGSAEPVTFSITATNSEPGAKDSAERFKYCAKASRADRNDGCDGLPLKPSGMVSNTSGQHLTRRDGGAPAPAANNHPTVKPTALMRWLCRLVTPPGGVVLDPFAGSGSTGRGAILEGFRFVGIELSEEYAAIARARIAAAERQRAEDLELERNTQVQLGLPLEAA